MRKFKTLALSFSAALLALLACTACGGGGTTGPVITGPTVPGPVTVNRARALSVESYLNAKNLDFFSETYPRDQHGYEPLSADASAFFRYPDGTPGLVASVNLYNIQQPQSQAIPGRIVFYRQAEPPTTGSGLTTNSGQWQIHTVAIDQQVQPCIHARKILVADFNRDSVPDFAIMCHGYDASPFPGEPSTILLSQGNGYTLTHITSQPGFYHGGSTADFNGDGAPDIAMTTIAGIRVYLNNGAGSFTASSTYTIPVFRRAFHVEMVDLNGDGHFDVVAGSHEWEDATRIIINPGNNQFSSGQVITIPSVPGAGVIVDFVYTPANNSLYILRTGDGQSNGTVFYQGLWLQKFSLTSRTSTVLLADPNWTDPRFGWPSRWLRWIDEEKGYITSSWGNAIRIKVE